MQLPIDESQHQTIINLENLYSNRLKNEQKLFKQTKSIDSTVSDNNNLNKVNNKNINSVSNKFSNYVDDNNYVDTVYQGAVTATPKPPTTELDDIFISVKTTKSYHSTRLAIIVKTWFQLAKGQVRIIEYFNLKVDEFYNPTMKIIP